MLQGSVVVVGWNIVYQVSVIFNCWAWSDGDVTFVRLEDQISKRLDVLGEDAYVEKLCHPVADFCSEKEASLHH